MGPEPQTGPWLALGCALGLILTVSCGTAEDKSGTDKISQPCESAEDCFVDVDHDRLSGDVECLDRVEDGYCTHQCTADEDCCAEPGVCDDAIAHVCAPFESTELMLCFVSCEHSDIEAADFSEEEGDPDSDLGSAYCQTKANESFICRSTGGGSDNRKVCVPEG
jgi:hypothetical protein